MTGSLVRIGSTLGSTLWLSAGPGVVEAVRATGGDNCTVFTHSGSFTVDGESAETVVERLAEARAELIAEAMAQRTELDARAASAQAEATKQVEQWRWDEARRQIRPARGEVDKPKD